MGELGQHAAALERPDHGTGDRSGGTAGCGYIYVYRVAGVHLEPYA